MLVLNRLPHPTPLHIYTGVSTGATLKTLWNLAYPGFDPHDINLHWHELSEQDPGETKLVEGITVIILINNKTFD